MVRQHHHQARAVCTGVNFEVFRNADEAREVIALILHRGGEAVKAVELSACAGRQRRHIVAAGLGHHARRHRGIFAADDLHIGKPL